MSVGRTLGPIAALVASAALGGVVAVGAVALLGGLGGGDTTVVTETSAAGGPALAPAGATGLSVHEIYERAASGVVRVNATTNSTSFDPRVVPSVRTHHSSNTDDLHAAPAFRC